MILFNENQTGEELEGDLIKEQELVKIVQERELDPNEVIETEGKHQCRICLASECSQEDPLISPCQCSGTMKYIHLGCL